MFRNDEVRDRVQSTFWRMCWISTECECAFLLLCIFFWFWPWMFLGEQRLKLEEAVVSFGFGEWSVTNLFNRQCSSILRLKSACSTLFKNLVLELNCHIWMRSDPLYSVYVVESHVGNCGQKYKLEYIISLGGRSCSVQGCFSCCLVRSVCLKAPYDKFYGVF